MVNDLNVSMYLNLPVKEKILFWQIICHDVTIALRLFGHSDLSVERNRNNINQGIQILHVLTGYCRSLLANEADEQQVDLLFKSILNYEGMQEDAILAALKNSELAAQAGL